MAKPSTEAVLRAQKERKQKIFVVVGCLVLVVLMAWQGPKTYKALRGGSAETPLPIVTPPPGSATTPGLGTSTSSTPEGSLPDSDVQPEPLDGQLLSFSRFFGRDPFTAARSSSGSQAVGTTAATIEVNGTSEDLAIGDSFPASDPTFKLVAVNAQAATIGLVSGSFSNGDPTISISVGETLVLQADDGARYAIKLVSVAGA